MSLREELGSLGSCVASVVEVLVGCGEHGVCVVECGLGLLEYGSVVVGEVGVLLAVASVVLVVEEVPVVGAGFSCACALKELGVGHAAELECGGAGGVGRLRRGRSSRVVGRLPPALRRGGGCRARGRGGR